MSVFSCIKLHKDINRTACLFFKQIKQVKYLSQPFSNEPIKEEANINKFEKEPFMPGGKPLPIVTGRKLEFLPKYSKPLVAWVETMATLEDLKMGMIDLHPDVFGAPPRIDVLHKNVQWQKNYKKISYAHTRTRAEIIERTTKKPWPQKGTGRARAANMRSPLFKGGGVARGPRGPKSFFYMLPTSLRARGLQVALSAKYAQDDLHIVDSLHIPTMSKQYMDDLLDTRFWGFSCLIVGLEEETPPNLFDAISEIPYINYMPLYGLNVYSMLKHETLVLTLDAVDKLEQKLLHQLHRVAPPKKYKYNDRYDEW